MRVTSVLFDRNVVNSIGCFYFPQTPRNSFFELLCFKMDKENLASAIRKAYKFVMNKYGILPRMVFIPFGEYAEYERQTGFDAESPTPIQFVCRDMGLDMVIMTPDMLKGSIAPILNIDEEI